MGKSCRKAKSHHKNPEYSTNPGEGIPISLFFFGHGIAYCLIEKPANKSEFAKFKEIALLEIFFQIAKIPSSPIVFFKEIPPFSCSKFAKFLRKLKTQILKRAL